MLENYICPVCGNRHDAPNTHVIVNMAVTCVIVDGMEVDAWKDLAMSLYSDAFDQKLIKTIHKKLKEKEAVTT